MSIKAYSEAINESYHQLMDRYSKVFQIGVGVNTPWYVGKTMNGLLDAFGDKRMIDTPVSENGSAGIAIGAAMTGMKPILTFPRMDFMYYAMDQICNHGAVLNYTFGGRAPVPLTIRAIINRGGEQGAQHSQALQAMFMHIPGLRVVMPSDAYDAKGMLIAAVESDDPVLYIDDRWLYSFECEVPDEYYSVPLDGAKMVIEGKDITVVSSSYCVHECRIAAEELAESGISIDLLDLRSIKPIDIISIGRSLEKTGRLLVVDGGWTTGGVSAEICARAAAELFHCIKAPIQRLALPDTPAPASKALEDLYYPDHGKIGKKIKEMLNIL